MRFSCSMRLEGVAGLPAPVLLHSPARQLFRPAIETDSHPGFHHRDRFGFGVLRSDSATPVSGTAPFVCSDAGRPWPRSPLTMREHPIEQQKTQSQIFQG
ncbi:hypothetical protein HMPREF9344_01562 [Cutibacterium acnes HL097PA1]|nr:hypothetical protein HMPREF9344_01562 [Cutibacterium acnes HL097PA1]